MKRRILKKKYKADVVRALLDHFIEVRPKDLTLQVIDGRLTHGYRFKNFGTYKPEKECPFCERKRRAGYYQACPDCIWIYDSRKNLDRLLDDLKVSLRKHNARLTWRHIATNTQIEIRIDVACDLVDAGERTVKANVRVFRSSQTISHNELAQAYNPKKIVMDLVLNIYKTLNEKISESVDDNGRVVELAGMTLGTAGMKWSDKMVAPFRRI